MELQKKEFILGMLSLPPSETLDLHEQELSEGELTDINNESDYDEKDEDIPEDMTPAKHNIKWTLRNISQHWKHKG